jgi:ribosomal-protein-alanine N-acetyltransferase
MLTLNFNPFPVLETERLLLRCIQTDDAPALFELRRKPEVNQFLDRDPYPTIEETVTFIQEKVLKPLQENEGILWVIVLKEDPARLIGTTGFWRMIKEHYRTELGYLLDPDYWNQGIMKEALLATIDFAFSKTKIHSIEANINPDNLASARLLEKCGFVREAWFRENYYFNGVFKDSVIYSLLNHK